MTSSEAQGEAVKPLDFHPLFSTKKEGDVILQSDGKKHICFYFPLSLLTASSSFFSGLPPPSATDLTHGVPLIPLSDTPSGALFVALSAIEAIHQAEPFDLPSDFFPSSLLSRKSRGVETIFAALWAKRYEVPSIYRILLEGIASLKPDLKLFLVWGIWCIAGVKREILQAALSTRGHDITRLPRVVADSLRQSRPNDWTRLQDLHLRWASGPHRFCEQASVAQGLKACDDCRDNVDADHTTMILEQFREAKTVREIFDTHEAGYDLECRDCVKAVRKRYEPAIKWLREHTSSYEIEEQPEQYD